MNLRSFLRLYIGSAILGACGFWAVACSSMLLAKRTSSSPAPHIKHIPPQTHLPVKPGASFESEVGPSLAAVNLPRSRGVRHDPARSNPKGSLLRNEPGSYLSSRDVGTTGPTIKRGWQSVTAGETAQNRTPSSRTEVPSGERWSEERELTRVGENPNEHTHADNVASESGVTGWRDSHFQTFRGGAAWKDTLLTTTDKPAGSEEKAHGQRYSHRPKVSGSPYGDGPLGLVGQAGIKPGRHLETFVWHPNYLAAQHLCGVPVRTIAAVVKAESGGDPWALSPSGARGLMQILPATAAELGRFNLWNPAENLVAGSCILRAHLDRRGGDLGAALADYHAGAWRTSTGPATRAYVEDVMGSAQ